jgi:flagellar protein FlaF
MGFSVSGSAAIIFAGMFIAFGMFYTATSNGFERISEARSESAEDMLEQRNTALNITEVTYNASGNDDLVIRVNNTGSTELAINDTDVLVDNDFQGVDDWDSYNVDGDTDTEVWLPGEQLEITISRSSDPTRVKVVTGPGLSDTEVV